MPDPFATVAELRTFLGRPTLPEDRAEQMLEIASDEVRVACGANLDPTTNDVVTLDGDGSPVLLLPNPPVSSVASVVLDPDGVAEALAYRTGYDWAAAGILRRVDGGFFPRRYRFVQVTYSHGLGVIPPVVRGVVLRMAARVIDNPEGLKQEALGRYSYTRAGESAGIGLLPADYVALGDLVIR